MLNVFYNYQGGNMGKFPDFPESALAENGKQASKTYTEYYSEEYRNMRIDKRDMAIALKSSDNGRCWWIYHYLMGNPFRWGPNKES